MGGRKIGGGNKFFFEKAFFFFSGCHYSGSAGSRTIKLKNYRLNKIKRTDTRFNEWSTNLHCCKRNNQTHKANKIAAIYGKLSLFFMETKFGRPSTPDAQIYQR